MSYFLNGGILEMAKGVFDPPKEPPPEFEAPEPEEMDEDIAEAYKQDPNCPEGQKKEGAACIDDPVYKEMVAELEAELAVVEAEEQAIAKREAEKAAKREAQEAAREELRRKMEAERLAHEQQLAIERAEEEEQIKMLAIYGIGGLGLLTIVTLLIKTVMK
jgi:hypothetical protein